MTTKQIIIRVLFWIPIFVVTLELCARVDDFVTYGAPFWGRFDNEILYTYDDLGKRGKPYGQYQKWKLNSLGFRGPDLQPGKFRIACIGSSETFGLYEAKDNEWPRQLEKELNRRANQPEFEVVNAAYPGMALATSLARLPELMEKAQPKIVLIYPSVANYIWLPYLRPYSGKPPARKEFQIRMVDRFENLLKSSLPESIQDYIRKYQMERAARKFSKIMDRVPEKNVERFQADLKRITDEIRKYGAQPVLVTHATRFGSEVQPPERPLLTAWRKFYPMLKEDGFLDMEKRMSEAMRELGASEDIPVIDAARRMPPGERYFVEFVHFTDEGAETLAKVVADGLTPILRCTGEARQPCLKTGSMAAAGGLSSTLQGGELPR